MITLLNDCGFFCLTLMMTIINDVRLIILVAVSIFILLMTAIFADVNNIFGDMSSWILTVLSFGAIYWLFWYVAICLSDGLK